MSSEAMGAYELNKASKGIQLISGDGHLLPTEQIRAFLVDAVEKFQGSDALRRTGVNYHVVGIFGGQSSGKSTLLNSLFRTTFQTMDETKHRGQTTRGAFIARAEFDASLTYDVEETNAAINGGKNDFALSPLFVLDFEGTDGIERGENQSFERKLSLFALSVADTLVINMWAVDVGRFNAANMSLLRTIFEVNLQLFSHESYEREEKPTLLVLLRDFTEKDPSHHFDTVRKSFDKIWETIVKPDVFQDCTIDTFFELSYHVLPHYKLQRDFFDAAIVEFRQWFYVPLNRNNLFRGRGMLRNVPLDGIPNYMSNCWEIIRSSKDLDIPTQREMLARHRCMEARSEAVSKFQELCTECVDRLNSGDPVPHLTDMLEGKIDELLAEFGTQTRLYNACIVQSDAAELKEELIGAELRLLGQYAKTIASTVVAGLDAQVGQTVDRALNWITQRAATLPLVSRVTAGKGDDAAGNGFSSDGAKHDCSNAFVINSEKSNELVQKFWERLCGALQVEVNLLTIGEEGSFQNDLAHIYGTYAAYIAEDAALQEMVAQTVLETVFQKVFYRFTSMAENAAETIHRAFERTITHGSEDTVRFFSTIKGLRDIEPKAAQAALVFLGCLLYYRLKLVSANTEEGEVKMMQGPNCSGEAFARLIKKRRKFSVCDNTAEQAFFFCYEGIFDVPRYPTNVLVTTATASENNMSVDTVDGRCVLLSPQAVKRAFDVYKQKCEFTMQMQYRSVQSVRQNFPLWIIPVMLVLGWNEMLYVFTSPLLLVGLIILATVFLRNAIYAQWEVFQETGPGWLVMTLRVVFEKLQSTLGTVLPTFKNDKKQERN